MDEYESLSHMRNLSELNVNEGGEAVKRQPPSPEVVLEFEREFDVTLPPDYLSLLMYSNGGHPELDTISPMGRSDIAARSVSRFYYLNENRSSSGSLWVAATHWRDILGAKMIPIAVDGGGNPFILDMAVTPPKVLACLHDEDFSLVEIAPSFSDFIDRLELRI